MDFVKVVEIETNVDDATGEIIGRTMERLFAEGALDVFLQNIIMKKGRPGILIKVLSKPQDLEKLSKVLMQESGTIGVRYSEKQRTCLPRSFGEVVTKWGSVKVKIFEVDGVRSATPEYESCKAIAEAAKVPVRHVYNEVIKGFSA